MLDETLGTLTKAIYDFGSDWVAIAIFIIAVLLIPYGYLAYRVPLLIVHSAGMFVFLVLSYLLFAAFPMLLFNLYLKLGLITESYLLTPEPYLFSSLFGSLFLTVGVVSLACMILFDIARGKPLTAAKIADKRWQEAYEAAEEARRQG